MKIVRFLLLLLASAAFLPANAQLPVWSKMSPLVRQACRQSMRSDVARAKPMTPSSRHIIAFVKANDNLSGVVADARGRLLAHYGSLGIAELPVSSLAALSARPEVKRIEARRGKHVLMDTTRLLLNITAANEGLNLSRQYTGSGVVVGVQDIGFDLTHPNFFSADMSRYRIKAFWDQLSLDTIGSTLPVGRDYTGEQTLLALGTGRDGTIQTHGTHTTGTAAGSGAEGKDTLSAYAGVAPDADLCLVNNVTTDDIELLNPDDYYKYTFALDALGFKYIFDYADRVGKPCVINFSEGSLQDFMGYDQLYYAMLDSLCGPGHIIVASAGNQGGLVNYVHKPAGVDSVCINAYNRGAISCSTRAASAYQLRVRMKGSATAQAASSQVAILLPTDSVLAAPDSVYTDTLIVGTDSLALAVMAYPESYDATQTIIDWVLTPLTVKSFTAAIAIVGADTDVELYPSSGTFSRDDSSANENSRCVIDNTHSILSPGSAPSVICVGASGYRTSFVNYLGQTHVYNTATNGSYATFSSVGPTFDGRVKPDVLAPGQNIISSYSSWYLANKPTANDINSDVRHFTHNGRTYAWNANSGTSMSAPIVTGIIALWLQANPRLTPADCLDIIAKTSTHYDASLSYPNNYYGYGQIDAAAGLALIEQQLNGITTIKADRRADGRIYTLDGRYVGTDSSRLPRGLYIQNGRKLLLNPTIN